MGLTVEALLIVSALALLAVLFWSLSGIPSPDKDSQDYDGQQWTSIQSEEDETDVAHKGSPR